MKMKRWDEMLLDIMKWDGICYKMRWDNIRWDKMLLDEIRWDCML